MTRRMKASRSYSPCRAHMLSNIHASVRGEPQKTITLCLPLWIFFFFLTHTFYSPRYIFLAPIRYLCTLWSPYSRGRRNNIHRNERSFLLLEWGIYLRVLWRAPWLTNELKGARSIFLRTSLSFSLYEFPKYESVSSHNFNAVHSKFIWQGGPTTGTLPHGGNCEEIRGD